MEKITLHIAILSLVWSCSTASKDTFISVDERVYQQSIIDNRDQTSYGIIEVGAQLWFAENLRFITPNSICYGIKEVNCDHTGRLYPSEELATVCPKGWRVPNINDWNILKHYFQNDSIHALLDTINWRNTTGHTNASGLSLQGVGYQMEKKLFWGQGTTTALWINQINKYDEYYHVHLYEGEGITFEKANHTTNEIFHAHPIEDLRNRRFSIRCMCDKR